jgi:hypothetical protein
MNIAIVLSALSIAFTLPDSSNVTAPTSAAQNGNIASTRIVLEPSNPFHDSKLKYSKPRPGPVPNPTVKGPLRNK